MENGIMFPPVPTCAGAGLCLRRGDDLPRVIAGPGARGLIYGAVKLNGLVFIIGWPFFPPRKARRCYLPSGNNPNRAEKPSQLLTASSSPQNSTPNPDSHGPTPRTDPARVTLPKPTTQPQIPGDPIPGIVWSGTFFATPRWMGNGSASALPPQPRSPASPRDPPQPSIQPELPGGSQVEPEFNLF